MQEAENQDVVKEVVSPAIEEVSNSHDHMSGNENQSQVTAQAADDKEMNFRALRESHARLQRQYEEEVSARVNLERSIEERLSSHLQPKEVDELDSVADDDWLTKKDAKKLAERQAKEIVSNMLAEERERRAKEELPQRLKSQHSDFDSVVTKENVEYLRANKPHIAASLASTKDPYAQALSAYDAIKAFCPSVQQRDDEAKMAKNASKPGTLGAAHAASPLSEAKAMERGLTPEMRRKFQQEMVTAMRGS